MGHMQSNTVRSWSRLGDTPWTGKKTNGKKKEWELMKRLSGSEIRRMFLEFFKQKGHKVEPSASLIPVDDPSLLWINSGVATLKKYFDGTLVPENPRITNVQKS